MIHAVKSLKGGDVTSLIEALMVLDKRLPVRIQTDNGSVFISKVWINGYKHDLTLDFSRPGKPTNNPFIETVTAASG